MKKKQSTKNFTPVKFDATTSKVWHRNMLADMKYVRRLQEVEARCHVDKHLSICGRGAFHSGQWLDRCETRNLTNWKNNSQVQMSEFDSHSSWAADEAQMKWCRSESNMKWNASCVSGLSKNSSTTWGGDERENNGICRHFNPMEGKPEAGNHSWS